VIAPEKLANYLLVKQARGDKSVFLASAVIRRLIRNSSRTT
jgi:hypothetical protein